MKKKISVTDLRLGMYLSGFCCGWTDHPFWRERFLLDNESDLSKILNSRVREVWIDTKRGGDVQITSDITDAKEAKGYSGVSGPRESLARPNVPYVPGLSPEVRKAIDVCRNSKEAVVCMFQEARMHGVLDLCQLAAVVDNIAESVTRNPHALISIARLKDVNEYTFMHSVAVCGLMIGLSRRLGFSESSVRLAGMAGLLHDVGKAWIPLEILDKPGVLSDSERTVINEHPLLGFSALSKCEYVAPEVLQACLEHHEKIDGSGYPGKLVGEDISIWARMVAVCDVYDAVTSDRPYKKGWDPADALHKMAEWRGHFDVNIFQSFVKMMGVYPVGSLVRLGSGSVAVVVSQNPSNVLKPVVKVFFVAGKVVSVPPVVLDLSQHDCNDHIVGRESDVRWKNTAIEKMWMTM